MSADVAGKSEDAGTQLGARALELVSTAVDIHAAGWFRVDARGRLRLVITSQPLPWPVPPEQAMRTYAHRFRRLDPYCQPDRSGAVRPVVTDATAAGALDLERLPFFQRFLAPMGLAHMASLNLSLDGRLGAQLWLGRGRRGRGFTTTETAVLQRLHGVLQAVLPVVTAAAAAPPLDQVGLTPRERDVARVAATGATNTDIARALHISPGTVRTHMHRIFAKLGVTTRAQLVRHLGVVGASTAPRDARRGALRGA